MWIFTPVSAIAFLGLQGIWTYIWFAFAGALFAMLVVYLVGMTGRATVVDSRTQTPASLDLVGVHGSLTPLEMLVPCLVVA